MITPHPGDTLIDRYDLVEALRQEPGLEAWRANDHVLARDCQLFIITNPAAAVMSNAIASSLALSRDVRFTPVLQMHSVDDVSVLVTDLDEGVSLSDYLTGPSRDTLSIDAMRVILGETALALKTLLSQGLSDRAVTTDVIRLSSDRIRLADAPISGALSGPLTQTDIDLDTDETLAVRQLAGVLYAMLTRTPYMPGQQYDEDSIIAVSNKPHEFWIICQRSLGFATSDGDKATPIRTLDEFIALLGYWKPLDGLTANDIVWPEEAGPASIRRAPVLEVDPSELLELPDALIVDAKHKDADSSPSGHDGTDNPLLPDWGTNQLLFPGRSEVEMVKPAKTGGDNLFAALHEGPAPIPVSHPTTPVNVLQIRNLQTELIGDSATSAKPSSQSPDTPSPLQKPDMATTEIPTPRVSAISGDIDDREHQAPSDEQQSKPASSEHHDQANEQTNEAAETHPAILHVDIAPPSFAPQERTASDSQIDDMASPYHPDTHDVDGEESTLLSSSDSVLFGKFTTRSVAIVMGTVFLIVALVLAMTNLLGSRSERGFTDPKAGQWPTDMSNVRFPGATATSASDSGNASSDSDTATATQSPEVIIDHSDRDVTSVPVPVPKPVVRNTTAYEISKQSFLSRPNKLNGYGWYVHLKDPHEIWKVDFRIRQKSGSGMIYVNSTQQNPNNGEPVGTFQIDAEGKASVELTQPVTTQDVVIWFPTQQLPPEKRLTFNEVAVY